MNPIIILIIPRERIDRNVFLTLSFESFFRIRVINKPERTIKGAFPFIMTPKAGLTGLRNSRRFSFERIFNTRKKNKATPSFQKIITGPHINYRSHQITPTYCSENTPRFK